LILLGPSKNEELFTRNSTTGRYTYDTTLLSRKEDAAHFEIYINDLKHVANKLFLQDIVTNKEAIYAENERLAILKQVYHWFEVLDISFPDSLVSGYSCFSTTSTDEILAAIRTFATGISHVEAKKVSKEKALEEVPSDFKKKIDKALVELVNQNKTVNPASGMRISCNGKLYLVRMNEKGPEFNEITFEHNKLKDVTFSMDEESDGTQRLFDMLTVLLCTKEPAVFVIDEIDRSLHPHMTVHFIKNFLALAKKNRFSLLSRRMRVILWTFPSSGRTKSGSLRRMRWARVCSYLLTVSRNALTRKSRKPTWMVGTEVCLCSIHSSSHRILWMKTRMSRRNYLED
jgi:hypothetical protein